MSETGTKGSKSRSIRCTAAAQHVLVRRVFLCERKHDVVQQGALSRLIRKEIRDGEIGRAGCVVDQGRKDLNTLFGGVGEEVIEIVVQVRVLACYVFCRAIALKTLSALEEPDWQPFCTNVGSGSECVDNIAVGIIGRCPGVVARG